MQRHARGGLPPAAPRLRVAGLVLLTAHLAFVGWLSLRPLSVPWVAPANFQPFASIRSDLAGGPREALTGIGGGLLLLAPLGVLLPVVTGRVLRPLPGTCVRTGVVGALLSLGIALGQSGVPGRVVNVDSVLLNASGAALTCLLLLPLVRAWLRRSAGASPTAGVPRDRRGPGRDRGVPRRDEAAQGSTPRAPRVGIAP